MINYSKRSMILS